MKKIIFSIFICFLCNYIFSQNGYKITTYYSEKNEHKTNSIKKVNYYLKNKNTIKKFSEENNKIYKEIELQLLEYSDSIILQVIKDQSLCSLYELCFKENNTITINKDLYLLESNSYNQLYSNTIGKYNIDEMNIDSILCLLKSTPYYLIDSYICDIPFDLITNNEKYKILEGHFEVQSPTSDFKFQHECRYNYDKNNNLMLINFYCINENFSGINYNIKTINNTKNVYQKNEKFSFFEQSITTNTTTINFTKNEIVIEGCYSIYKHNSEYDFSKVIICNDLTEQELQYLNRI